ncbi:hydrophobin [Moniliophthora roreri MCA 2997]|uniref:Hydrophobin n=2 Tax=Moniliophthora roreri TaxID=221103 RepID=V2Y5A5_MONRO|nr:hydrophobin [Moniliophthora roreri MCA 2997]
MFARISAAFIYVLMAFTVLAAATCTPTTVTVTPPASTATQPASQCNTGPIQCCNSVQSASSTPASNVLGLLGVTLTDLNVLVGLTCSPVTILGGIFGGCSATPVCCENNSFGGVIAIGCVPVNLSLRK